MCLCCCCCHRSPGPRSQRIAREGTSGELDTGAPALLPSWLVWDLASNLLRFCYGGRTPTAISLGFGASSGYGVYTIHRLYTQEPIPPSSIRGPAVGPPCTVHPAHRRAHPVVACRPAAPPCRRPTRGWHQHVPSRSSVPPQSTVSCTAAPARGASGIWVPVSFAFTPKPRVYVPRRLSLPDRSRRPAGRRRLLKLKRGIQASPDQGRNARTYSAPTSEPVNGGPLGCTTCEQYTPLRAGIDRIGPDAARYMYSYVMVRDNSIWLNK